MPKGWRNTPFGPLTAVQTKLDARCRSFHLPPIDWSDSAWGILEAQGFSIEFNMGEDAVCDTFMLHVRGGGSAARFVAHLADEPDWYAFDTSAGEWLHLMDDVSRGWEAFQSYRNVVVPADRPRSIWARMSGWLFGSGR
ncbi:MAG: hypothetical protein AAGH68_05120 [Pseudomonadota bacterium]